MAAAKMMSTRSTLGRAERDWARGDLTAHSEGWSITAIARAARRRPEPMTRRPTEARRARPPSPARSSADDERARHHIVEPALASVPPDHHEPDAEHERRNDLRQ